MILLAFDKSANEFFLSEEGTNLAFKGKPEEFAIEFKKINPGQEFVSLGDKNEMLASLARSGFGNADCLRNAILVSIDSLIDAFGVDYSLSGDMTSRIMGKWACLKDRANEVFRFFPGLKIGDLPYPTVFFTQAMRSMGLKPKRNDRDWWLESGLWKVKGPLGYYCQNTHDGQSSFEPFQIKGGFKMNRLKESRFAGCDCLVYDLKNAGPSHIVYHNISPETKCLDDLGYVPPLNGIWWRKDKIGCLPQICMRLIELRETSHAEHFAKKMLASAVGVFGNKNCALYDVDIARSATRALRNTVRRLGVNVPKSKKLPHKVCWTYADNDSVGFSLSEPCENQIQVDEYTKTVKAELFKINPQFEIKLESVKSCNR